MRAHEEAVRTGPPRSSLLAHVLALCAGLAGVICAVALPFAPVWTDRTEVRWPPADEPATSTTALLAPYRPAEFTASVPCSAIRSATERPEPTTVLSTIPPGSDRDGMVLTTREGEPELVLGQRRIPLPRSPDCGLTVRADSAGSQVAAGDRAPIALPGISAPEIFTFRTDLDQQRAAQLSVSARTFSWFDTSPTPAKRELITASLVFAGLALLLLFAHAPPSVASLRRALLRRRRWTSLLLLPTDAAMAGVLAVWGIVGPLTDDDGFAMRTVLNYGPTGDIGNYYRWFNASETPFTLLQHVVRWVSEHSLAPVVLRLPSVAAGLLTWLVVSRGIVAPLCGSTRRVRLHLLTGVLFLACWLPYGLGIRPEAFIALGAASVVAMLLKATSGASRTPFCWLGAAAATSGLTVAITPTGVAALFAVLVFLPRIVRLITTPGRAPRWVGACTRLALVGSLAAVGLVAMFADSTWNGVKQASAIHQEFGPTPGWYREINRYAKLLGTDSWGSAGKRIAVLLVVAALLIAAACALRQLHRRARVPELPLLIGSVVGVFAALWLTPSKWSHHFGALAGLGAALLAVTIVLLGRVGSLAGARLDARLLGGAGGIAAAVAAALSFAGPNAWWRYSDIAMPWSDAPVRPFGWPLDHPAFWIAVGVATGVLVFAGARPRRPGSRAPEGPLWTPVPASVLGLAALASVLLLLGSFVTVPARTGEHFSIARANWSSITGTNCGIEDEVETLPLAEAGTLRPVGSRNSVGGPEIDGFARDVLPDSGAPPEEPELREDPFGTYRPTEAEPKAVSATPFVWSSLPDDPATVGSLRTRWFGLPELAGDQALSTWVAGRPEQGNSLSIEFADARGNLVGTRELRDAPPQDRPFDDPVHGRPRHWRDFRPWRLLTVDAGELPPGAAQVRLRAEDNTTDEQGWLAVGGPAVRDVVPLRHVLDGQPPALVDWPINFEFPCRDDYPRVGGGTADSPGVLVTPAEGEGSMAFDPEYGGVFTGALSASRRLETPSRLRGEPGVTWGHVLSVAYDVDRDSYDLREKRVRGPGSGGDAPYPFEER